MKKIISKSIEDTFNLGKEIGKKVWPDMVISLRGSLGAGKTVLTKGLASQLEIDDEIVSPTFTLIQEYEGKDYDLYHMDMYRINSVDDFIMTGGDELLSSGGVSVVEWSEKISECLPDDTVYISIKILDNEDREITIEGLN